MARNLSLSNLDLPTPYPNLNISESIVNDSNSLEK